MSMDRAHVLAEMHKIASGLAATNGHTASETPSDVNGNILQQYGFSSLDAVEYLLLLEEELGVTFEDEDLSEDILVNENNLADYILQRQA